MHLFFLFVSLLSDPTWASPLLGLGDGGTFDGASRDPNAPAPTQQSSPVVSVVPFVGNPDDFLKPFPLKSLQALVN